MITGSQNIFFILILSSLVACAGMGNRSTIADRIAQQGGLEKQVIDTGQFLLTTYHRHKHTSNSTLVIYIEGDGLAFRRRAELSTDPTPGVPTALQLAARDPSPAVLYIARPCQFLSEDKLVKCESRYWSSHRYAEEVVSAVNTVIDSLSNGYHKIGLVGYSGGGSVAALVASRRTDVSWLVTIAANLDHEAWTAFHHVTPLAGSLNPSETGNSLQNLPQLHLAGNKDTVVPVSVIQSFINKVRPLHYHLAVLPDFDHYCCWADAWPDPVCTDATSLDTSLNNQYCH